jgi:hypothetical protein
LENAGKDNPFLNALNILRQQISYQNVVSAAMLFIILQKESKWFLIRLP